MISCLWLTAALIFSAWAYGTTLPWTWRIAQALVIAAVATHLVSLCRRDGPAGACRTVWQWRWGLPLIALSIFIAIQSLNASHVCTGAVDAPDLTPRPHLPWLPRSVSAPCSLGSLDRLLTYAAVLAATTAAWSTRRRFWVVSGLLASGGTMACLAILQRMRSPAPPHLMTGMFVNENNYAEFANLLLPLALCLGRGTQLRAQARLERSHPGYLLYLCAGVLLVSIALSGSRAGVAVAILVLATWGAMEAWSGPQAGSRGRRLALLALPVGVALGLLLLAGTQGISVDLRSSRGLSVGLAARWDATQAVLRSFAERWAGGTGAGTFACAFPYYKPDSLAKWFFRYAHNDWLQYLSELGAVGFALLSALGLGAAWPLLRRQMKGQARRPQDGAGCRARAAQGAPPDSRTLRRYERRAYTLGLCAVGLHGAIDFPMHIPAIALLATALVGLGAMASTRPPGDAGG